MNQQCKVCGEPAAGFHFGAFTCEGCKSFFGRTYNNMNSISECKNNGDCVINKKNRTSCKSCRLRKCLLVGMSKSGSRYGRRSNWFKIHCLLQEQGSSVPPNGLAGGFPNGSLYPGLFNARHMLSADKFLETRLNGFSPFADAKHHHFLTDLEKYRGTSSSDSGGSSAGDPDDESRSTSAASGPRAPLHQTPSPFSDKDFAANNNNHHHHPPPAKLSATSSPVGGRTTAPSPFTSPPGHTVYTSSPYASPSHPLLPPYLPFAAVTRPGVTPAAPANLVFLDSLAGHPSMRGGDLLAFSPAAGGLAVEQEQPIDLSVKTSCVGGHSPAQRAASRTSSASPKSGVGDDDDELQRKEVKGVHTIPLDLTSKRAHELTTHSS